MSHRDRAATVDALPSPTLGRVIDDAREQLGRRIRGLIAGPPEPPDRHTVSADDPGLFGPGSATWAVHGDVGTLVGGLRALLLQTLHPPTMAGVADHSSYRTDPLGRLHRTAAFVGATTFGTTAEAEAAIARVRRIHDRVVGTTPDGRPYRANDPHLLAWVHCTEVDSFLRARQRYGATTITEATADAYVDEMAIVGEKLGVLEAPRSRAELRVRLEHYRPELHAGGQARETVRFLAWPPLPLSTRPSYGILFSAAASMLPGFARRMLRLPVAPFAEPLAIRPAATVLLRTVGWALGEGRASSA